MTGVILKNTGKLFLALAVLAVPAALNGAEIKTELVQSRIHEGESASLKLMISGSTSDIEPLKVPGVKGLNISFRGSTRSFQFINGDMWSGTILNFSIYGEKKGTYRIPPFVLRADGEKLVSQQVTLTVLAGSPDRNVQRQASSGFIRGGIQLSSETAVAGEPVIMRYYLYHSGAGDFEIEGIRSNPEARGFLVKRLDERMPDGEEIRDGVSFIRTHVATYCLIPAGPGQYSPGGGSIVISVERGGGFFSMPVRKEIGFPEKGVRVLSVPEQGRPDGFRGDVGSFTLQASVPDTEAAVYDEIRIPVKVTGRGNLLTLSKPEPEKKISEKILIEDGSTDITVQDNALTGEKEYLLTLIPSTGGTVDLGRLKFDFYNPEKGKYETAWSGPLSIRVRGGEKQKNEGEVKFESSGNSPEMNIPLVAVIVVLAAGAVSGVVFRERKKYRAAAGSNAETRVQDSGESSFEKMKKLASDMEEAFEKNQDDDFLRCADIALQEADSSRLAEDAMQKLKSVKETVYACRYGGARPEQEELKRIYEFMKKNIF